MERYAESLIFGDPVKSRPTHRPAGSTAKAIDSREFRPAGRNSAGSPLNGGDRQNPAPHAAVADFARYRQEIMKNRGGSTISRPAGSTTKVGGPAQSARSAEMQRNTHLLWADGSGFVRQAAVTDCVRYRRGISAGRRSNKRPDVRRTRGAPGIPPGRPGFSEAARNWRDRDIAARRGSVADCIRYRQKPQSNLAESPICRPVGATAMEMDSGQPRPVGSNSAISPHTWRDCVVSS